MADAKSNTGTTDAVDSQLNQLAGLLKTKVKSEFEGAPVRTSASVLTILTLSVTVASVVIGWLVESAWWLGFVVLPCFAFVVGVIGFFAPWRMLSRFPACVSMLPCWSLVYGMIAAISISTADWKPRADMTPVPGHASVQNSGALSGEARLEDDSPPGHVPARKVASILMMVAAHLACAAGTTSTLLVLIKQVNFVWGVMPSLKEFADSSSEAHKATVTFLLNQSASERLGSANRPEEGKS